ncbi:2Fe-2S iron-sulfur cluster-binding protein [Variovorax saccharolyticus]|uniref:2Fe-2S iron-sulfur cluster-binding protein n=1 Tax=Variovorax saccharolyticus TaxID=3053516 RepID=UPI002575E86F|nr:MULTISPECIES: 2Fe-2S iron-sulfur cluster-binding protein [unclassified Variovorax]MDM0022563.1 2Fe-2S iron-sulfur cluster-binding protein [Variovorax sp. J22R187]MDM0028511.1 2Fe-2S iron-sulfur cluster-binding protein [Variovorax sp. J31P216]
MKADIAPGGFSFDCGPGLTLLQAADAAGIELPSSCRNGTCRTCLCRLVEGSVRYRIEWPGVSADEKVEGWILPCVAEPMGDVRLEVPYAVSLIS